MKPQTTEKQSITIGSYTLSYPILVPLGDKQPYMYENHFWLQHESGEGTSVDPAALIKVIDKLFEDIF
jgi:hypothetical protein